MKAAEESSKMKPSVTKISKNFFSKVELIASNITVEPVLFLTVFPSILYKIVTINLYMEKACRLDLALNTTICDALTRRDNTAYTPVEEADVQKLSSEMIAIKSAIQAFFPLCLIIFAGSWSDRHNKRKPVIIAPIIGEFLSCICLILNTIFFYQLPLIVTMLSETLPQSLLGGPACLFLGMYSFVGTMSSKENRTLRIGALTTTNTISLLTGFALSGILFSYLGFIATFSLCAIMTFTAIILAQLLIKEDPFNQDNKKEENNAENKKKGIMMDFFDLKNIWNTFKVCFRNGPNNRRSRLMIVNILVLLVTGSTQGESAVIYLYSRYKFGWSAVQFGVFTSLHLSIQCFGNVIAMVYFSKHLHWNDATLGIIGLTNSIVCSLIFSAAPRAEYFIAGATFDWFGFTSHFVLRSLIAKIVPAHEQGQVNSVYGVCEALSPLMFAPLYTLLYKNTIDIFPGLFYVISAGIKAIGVCLFAYLYFQIIRDEKIQRSNVQKSTTSYGLSPELESTNCC